MGRLESALGTSHRESIVVRRLGVSDLGLFGAARAGLAGRQRAIQMDAAVVNELLTPKQLAAREVNVRCVCLDGARATETRPLGKPQRNWRIGGPVITDPFYDDVAIGDVFVGLWTAHANGTLTLQWRVLMESKDPALRASLTEYVDTGRRSSMALIPSDSSSFDELAKLLRTEQELAERGAAVPPLANTGATAIEASKAPARSKAARAPAPRRMASPAPAPKVRDKIRSPHILAEMLRVSSELSAPAQADFLELFALYAEDFRQILLKAGAIKIIERNHRRVWHEARGKLIASIDGGVAGLTALGSAPMAIRAGAYLVRPGTRGPEREDFKTVLQLVDETYAVFKGGFPDSGALRDAARISIETAAGLQICRDYPDLDLLILHGALVDPVSRYSDDVQSGTPFPSFSEAALRKLLPNEDPPASGRRANFIDVHLRQLLQLASSRAVVCSVVERESASRSVARTLLETVIDDEHVEHVTGESKASWRRRLEHDFLDAYRVVDTLLFRCVLNPGEYLIPVAIDRNDPTKAPRPWITEVAAYPKPHVSYFLPSARMAPVRMEVFEKDVTRFDELAGFLMHCAWLLPGYAFPVSLDIVDKFAKVPAWMSRSVQEHAAVEVLRRAIDTKRPEVISAARKLLTGGVRDWLFRPGV